MFGQAVTYERVLEFAISETVDKSQQWILSAIQRHGPELVTMLWRILGNEQDVCDAYQSTFLQLAHYQNRQKPKHIKAYIFRTASNVAVSMLRHRIVERERLSITVVPKKPLSSPANDFDSKCLQETLRCCIARLPEYLRNVITLHDLAEFSYAQIGGMLGISAATARVYRCKAFKLLSVWMSKEEREIK